MKTPRAKYQNDPQYRQFVDMIHSMLEHAYFTPSEVREMAVLACIMYEERRVQAHEVVHTPELEEHLRGLHQWTDKETQI